MEILRDTVLVNPVKAKICNHRQLSPNMVGTLKSRDLTTRHQVIRGVRARLNRGDPEQSSPRWNYCWVGPTPSWRQQQQQQQRGRWRGQSDSSDDFSGVGISVNLWWRLWNRWIGLITTAVHQFSGSVLLTNQSLVPTENPPAVSIQLDRGTIDTVLYLGFISVCTVQLQGPRTLHSGCLKSDDEHRAKSKLLQSETDNKWKHWP